MELWAWLLLVAGTLAVLVAAGIALGLRRTRDRVRAAWADLEARIRERHELVPPLERSVQEYASHERTTLDATEAAYEAALRPAVGGGPGPSEQARLELALESAMGELLRVADAYPDLRAEAEFAALRADWDEADAAVAAGRRLYNAHVRALDARLRAPVAGAVAALARVRAAEYFAAD